MRLCLICGHIIVHRGGKPLFCSKECKIEYYKNRCRDCGSIRAPGKSLCSQCLWRQMMYSRAWRVRKKQGNGQTSQSLLNNQHQNSELVNRSGG